MFRFHMFPFESDVCYALSKLYCAEELGYLWLTHSNYWYLCNSRILVFIKTVVKAEEMEFNFIKVSWTF